MRSYAFLFWAYTVIWLALAGYLLLLLVRLARVRRRLEAVERALGGSGREEESTPEFRTPD